MSTLLSAAATQQQQIDRTMASSAVVVSVEEMMVLGVPKAKAEQTLKNKGICALLRMLVDQVCTGPLFSSLFVSN